MNKSSNIVRSLSIAVLIISLMLVGVGFWSIGGYEEVSARFQKCCIENIDNIQGPEKLSEFSEILAENQQDINQYVNSLVKGIRDLGILLSVIAGLLCFYAFKLRKEFSNGISPICLSPQTTDSTYIAVMCLYSFQTVELTR